MPVPITLFLDEGQYFQLIRTSDRQGDKHTYRQRDRQGEKQMHRGGGGQLTAEQT
jgi:hypothetical protein